MGSEARHKIPRFLKSLGRTLFHSFGPDWTSGCSRDKNLVQDSNIVAKKNLKFSLISADLQKMMTLGQKPRGRTP